MTPVLNRRAVIYVTSIIGTYILFGFGEAEARATFQTGKGGKIVSASGLSPASDCLVSRISGVIGNVQFENGVARGMDFKSKKESMFINIPALYDFQSETEKQNAVSAYKELIVKGRSASLVVKVCGAGGRIIKLDAIR